LTASAQTYVNHNVASRLQTVTSADELDGILSELAFNPDSRWTRTQVLFYLADTFHSLAEEYFNGERVIVPDRKPLCLEAVDPVRLRDIVASVLLHEEDPIRNASAVAGDFATLPSPDHTGAPSLGEMNAPPPIDDADVIGNVLQALKQEALTVDTRAPKRYRLTGGRCVASEGDHFVYTFQWSSEPEPFVPGELRIGSTRIDARVGLQGDDDRTFQIWASTFLGIRVDSAVFSIDPTFLLRTLYAKLRPWTESLSGSSGVASDLFSSPESFAYGDVAPVAGLNLPQSIALSVAAASRRSYVWGPPGTGKTTCLGRLIRRLVDDGKRVLVLSPYNIAVDEAVLAAERCGGWKESDIVRVGRISEAVRRRHIDLDSHLEQCARKSGLLAKTRQLHASVMRELAHKERPTPGTIRKCVEELGEAVIAAGRGGDSATVKQVETATRIIRSEFRAPELEIINGARVVATTVALSMISAAVMRGSFDHVVVDEASVIRVPEALFIALSTQCKLSFFGDPRQLPPIVANRTPESDRWLKRNPFDMAQIATAADAAGTCVLLTIQHRMAAPIRELISSLFYEGKLEDGTVPRDGRVVLVDTSNTSAKATTRWIKMSQSKENLVHRGVVAGLMMAVRRKHPAYSILVLSPYRAQKKAYERESTTNRISHSRFATVHTSQGTEADVVILDLVISPGRGKSRFMNERLSPDFINLVNVAMSRAKHELLIVGHAGYIAEEYKGGLVHKILNHVRSNGVVLTVPGDLRMGKLFAKTWAQ